MFSAADVSVIIPSYNAETTIRACLTALTRQTAAPREIIVVDSGQDGTQTIIQQHFPGVTLIALERQTFPGPARNLGAAQASGAVLAFLDADCLPGPHWVEQIAAWHSQGHAAAGGAVSVGNPQSSLAWAGHLMEFREFLPVGAPRAVEHIPSCNVSYRRDLFLNSGGFPDAYYPQEDLLFDFYLARRGTAIWFDPGIAVGHIYRDRLRSYLAHQHRIGRVTCCTLRRLPVREGIAARTRLGGALAAPLLGLVKAARTLAIFARRYPAIFLRRPAVTGYILLGAAWWARGFQAGALRGLGNAPGQALEDEAIFGKILAAGNG